ncbi:hypothetical protein [Rubripirellula lacrimiformis]|nr:hypothetical protein [Rubripirellula lacrimiformis]
MSVDPPRQRLATSKSSGDVEVTVTTRDDGTLPTDRYVADRSRTRNSADGSARDQIARTETSRQGQNGRLASSQQMQSEASEMRVPTMDTGKNPVADRVAAASPPAKQNSDGKPGSPSTDAQISDQTKQVAYQLDSGKQPKSEPSNRAAIESAAQDHSDLMAAFSDYPPEVQREALRRLVAATARTAQETSQPDSLHSALTRKLDSLPVLPAALTERPEEVPVRLASSDQRAGRQTDAHQPTSMSLSDEPSSAGKTAPVASVAAIVADDDHDHPAGGHPVTDGEAAKPESGVVQSIADAPAKTQEPVQTVSASSQASEGSQIAQASVPADTENSDPASKDAHATAATPTPAASSASQGTDSMYATLVKRLSQAPPGETESQRSSRMIKLRHLMVLSGDLDSAVQKIEGMSESEQEFLRHQLLGLWTMVDPDGHPVPSRRITTALPQLREATKFAAAATDSLEVRSLAFCTEIESYGQIKRFQSNRFSAGQQVILYCEIENFSVNKNSDGFETHLQGSYDVYNAANEKVVSQLLPADKQVSANYLRDYFIAYQMHLPNQLATGAYRLQLTMEDVNGKKYGQTSIQFEIKQ